MNTLMMVMIGLWAGVARILEKNLSRQLVVMRGYIYRTTRLSYKIVASLRRSNEY